MGNPKRKFLFYTKLEISLHFGPTSSFEYLNIFDTLLLPKRFDSFSEVFFFSSSERWGGSRVGFSISSSSSVRPVASRRVPDAKTSKEERLSGSNSSSYNQQQKEREKRLYSDGTQGWALTHDPCGCCWNSASSTQDWEGKKEGPPPVKSPPAVSCLLVSFIFLLLLLLWLNKRNGRTRWWLYNSIGAAAFLFPPFLGPRYEPFFRSAISFSCLIWLFFFFMSPVNGIKSAMEKPLKPVIDSQWNENKNFFLSFFAAAHPEPRKEMGLFWVSVGQSVRRPSCIILVTRFFSFWERRVGVADADGAQKPTAEDTPSEITQRSSSSFL